MKDDIPIAINGNMDQDSENILIRHVLVIISAGKGFAAFMTSRILVAHSRSTYDVLADLSWFTDIGTNMSTHPAKHTTNMVDFYFRGSTSARQQHKVTYISGELQTCRI